MERKINLFINKKIPSEKMPEIFQGWNAYAKWANILVNILNVRKEIINKLNPPKTIKTYINNLKLWFGVWVKRKKS